MDLGCPLLRGSSDRRLRRRAATVKYLRKLIGVIVSLDNLYGNIKFGRIRNFIYSQLLLGTKWKCQKVSWHIVVFDHHPHFMHTVIVHVDVFNATAFTLMRNCFHTFFGWVVAKNLQKCRKSLSSIFVLVPGKAYKRPVQHCDLHIWSVTAHKGTIAYCNGSKSFFVLYLPSFWDNNLQKHSFSMFCRHFLGEKNG